MNPDSARVIYLTNTAADVSGYKRAPLPPAILAAENTMTGAGATGSEVLIEEFITDALGITSLLAGDWTFKFYLKVSASADATTAKIYVYTRVSAGTETELFSVSSAELNNTEPELVTITHNEASPTAVTVTDRLVVKVYHVTDSASSKTTTLYLEGATNQSRIIVPFDVPISHGDMFKKVYDPDGAGDISGGTSTGVDILQVQVFS